MGSNTPKLYKIDGEELTLIGSAAGIGRCCLTIGRMGDENPGDKVRPEDHKTADCEAQMTDLTERLRQIPNFNAGKVAHEAAGEIDRLRALLGEAADEIESWGAYASDYFQQKHDLAGAVDRFRAASR